MSDIDNTLDDSVAVEESSLNDIFNNNDSKNESEEADTIDNEKPKEPKKASAEKPVEKKLETKKETESKESKAKAAEKNPSKDDDNDDDEDDDVKEDPRSAEIEKLKKALQDNQKWGHNNNRKLKKLVKVLNSLKEQDLLSEEEVGQLDNIMNLESEEDESNSLPISNDPLINLIQIADKRLMDLRDIYEDDPLFEKKQDAFGELINNSTQEEREDILDELEPLKNSPLKLAKKMYAMGAKFYEEFYKDIDDAGGIKGMVAKKNEELARLQKKVDKLTKRLLKFEDYDKPTHRIDELGDTTNVESKTHASTLEAVFAERDSSNRR